MRFTFNAELYLRSWILQQHTLHAWIYYAQCAGKAYTDWDKLRDSNGNGNVKETPITSHQPLIQYALAANSMHTEWVCSSADSLSRNWTKNWKLEISAKKITVDRRTVCQFVSYMSKFADAESFDFQISPHTLCPHFCLGSTWRRRIKPHNRTNSVNIIHC